MITDKYSCLQPKKKKRSKLINYTTHIRDMLRFYVFPVHIFLIIIQWKCNKFYSMFIALNNKSNNKMMLELFIIMQFWPRNLLIIFKRLLFFYLRCNRKVTQPWNTNKWCDMCEREREVWLVYNIFLRWKIIRQKLFISCILLIRNEIICCCCVNWT